MTSNNCCVLLDNITLNNAYELGFREILINARNYKICLEQASIFKHKVEQKEIKGDLNHRTGDPKLKMKIYNRRSNTKDK